MELGSQTARSHIRQVLKATRVRARAGDGAQRRHALLLLLLLLLLQVLLLLLVISMILVQVLIQVLILPRRQLGGGGDSQPRYRVRLGHRCRLGRPGR
jgi:Flp pilus assembly protein TadB